MTLLILYILVTAGVAGADISVPFWKNYRPMWGDSHVQVTQDGSTASLVLDKTSGGGFESKLVYGSGFFNMSIKLPPTDTFGVLPTFYLMAPVATNIHDELDFEFIGSDRTPFTLSTNIFIHGVGGREEKIKLWFDPRSDYHDYSLLWNAHITVFYVDGIPIRMLKNASAVGAGYPTEPMNIMATNWFADWTLGGRAMDWSRAPFIASYRDFRVEACPDTGKPDFCSSPDFWWNRENFWQLDPKAEVQYKNIRKKYLVYDYCTDKLRYPVPPPECGVRA